MAYDASIISTPDIEYAADYFPQIAARIRRMNRVRVPEITNEDERELFIQVERAFALMAHFNNVLMDLGVNSMFLRTSKIPESAKMLLQLFGTDLFPANPARVEILATLSARYAATTRLLEAHRRFSTKRTPDYPEIVFENPVAIDTSARTDSQALTYGYGMIYERQSLTTATLSSIEPNIVYDSTAPFTIADVGKYMVVWGSVYGGNDLDFRRILEVADDVGAGAYRKVRLKNASFITETSISWDIYGVTTNHATNWNAAVASDPWAAGVMTAGDCIYIGHPDVMWNRIDVTLDAGTAGAGYKSVWEFYDPQENSTHPDDVLVGVPAPGQLTFNVNSLLGVLEASGALVEVEYIPTGAKYRKISSFLAPNNIVVINSYLDQPLPLISSNETDYIVRCDWRPLPDLVDQSINAGTSSWSKNGRADFTVPRTQDNSWYKYRILDPTTAIDNLAFFLRLRIVDPVASNGIIPARVRIDQGKEYIVFQGIQGQTVEEIVSSNGQANQSIRLHRKPYVYDSLQCYVTEGSTEYEWTVASSFLRARSTTRRCVIDPQTDGTALLNFGDGVTGRIPPIGSNNVRVTYRISADDNGNVGANTLTINRDGVGSFKAVTNPRQGYFWLSPEWSSQIDLEHAKTRAAQGYQVMHRSVAPGDAVILAKAFKSIRGTRIVSRAKSYEEKFGPKTIELVVVGGGGSALSNVEKAELEEYFNGGDIYGYPGINLFNSRIIVTNYIPRMIALNVRVEAYPIITESLIKQLLASILSPTALESSGRSFMWRFGQSVSLSRISSEIFKLSPGNIFDVNFDPTATDFVLVSRELPMFDAVGSNITVIGPTFEE